MKGLDEAGGDLGINIIILEYVFGLYQIKLSWESSW